MEIASGYYLNVYDRNGKKDVFVIFNEPNSEPTGEELNILAALIESELEKEPSGRTLRDAIEASELDCVEFGVQIHTKGLNALTLEKQIQSATHRAGNAPSNLQRKKEDFRPVR